MISLNVEDYCQNCKDFRACTETQYLYSDNKNDYMQHVISCENQQKCKSMIEYLASRKD